MQWRTEAAEVNTLFFYPSLLCEFQRAAAVAAAADAHCTENAAEKISINIWCSPFEIYIHGIEVVQSRLKVSHN